MDGDERTAMVHRELVHGGGVHLRLPDAAPDESWVFLGALLIGSFLGLLAAALR